MTPFVQQMLGRRHELDKKISTIQQKLLNYPSGKLICTQNGNYIKWYHSDGHIQTYIPKKKREYAEQLAAKKYWTLRLEELIREQRAVESYLKYYSNSPVIEASEQCPKLKSKLGVMRTSTAICQQPEKKLAEMPEKRSSPRFSPIRMPSSLELLICES